MRVIIDDMNTNFTIALYFALVIVATLFLFGSAARARLNRERTYPQKNNPEEGG